MGDGSRDPIAYRSALDAVKQEMQSVEDRSRAPHTLAGREAERKGQLSLDWKELSKKLGQLREVLPVSRRPAFDQCVQDVAAAFGAVVLHAAEDYDDELNRIRGWREFWRDLDNAVRAMRQYLDKLPTTQERSDLRGENPTRLVVNLSIDDKNTA